jgi:antitoxin VapB
MSATAKVFMTGRSQAVRLPKEFRVHTDELLIERRGESLVLTPKPDVKMSWAAFAHAAPLADVDIMQGIDDPSPDRNEDPFVDVDDAHVAT